MSLGEGECRIGLRIGGRRWLKDELVSNGSRGLSFKETTNLMLVAAATMEGS